MSWVVGIDDILFRIWAINLLQIVSWSTKFCFDVLGCHSVAKGLTFMICFIIDDSFVFSLINGFVVSLDSSLDFSLRLIRIVIANSTNAQITNVRHTSKYIPKAFNSDSDGLSDYICIFTIILAWCFKLGYAKHICTILNH